MSSLEYERFYWIFVCTEVLTTNKYPKADFTLGLAVFGMCLVKKYSKNFVVQQKKNRLRFFILPSKSGFR